MQQALESQCVTGEVWERPGLPGDCVHRREKQNTFQKEGIFCAELHRLYGSRPLGPYEVPTLPRDQPELKEGWQGEES